MTMQARLAELIRARGADVLADPGEFRAALDDYLTDDEISPGDRNVLTDAVRLGAVPRLLSLLDQGSDPRAAVAEAGVALARERGSDDARRSLRATALLGYAVGRLDESVLQSFESAPPPPPAAPPVPPPPAPTAPPAPLPPTRVAVPEPAVVRQRGRLRPAVVLGVGAVVVLLVVGLGWWFVIRGQSPEEGLEEWFSARSCDAAAERMTGPAAESLQAEIDAGDDSGLCAHFAEYASEYDVSSVDERGDRATIEVEGTQHYDGNDDSVPDERDFSATFDLRRVDGEWLVSNLQWTYADE